MHSLDDPMIMREIIMDHYQNPRNHGLVDDDSYQKVNMDSSTCIDDIDVQAKFNGDVVEDVRFDGGHESPLKPATLLFRFGAGVFLAGGNCSCFDTRTNALQTGNDHPIASLQARGDNPLVADGFAGFNFA